MTPDSSGRGAGWRRVSAGTLFSVLALAACSDTGKNGHGAASSPVSAHDRVTRGTVTTPVAGRAGSPAASPEAGARDLLDRAAVVTAALHSYAFSSAESFVVGGTPREAKLTGRAAPPDRLTYVVESGCTHTEVTVLPTMTYRRNGAGAWRRAAAKPGPSPDASLLSVLRSMSPTASSGRTITGTLSDAQARAAGLFGRDVTSTSTRIDVDLDSSDHVTRLHLTITGTKSGAPVTIDLATTFGSFNSAAAITAPM